MLNRLSLHNRTSQIMLIFLPLTFGLYVIVRLALNIQGITVPESIEIPGVQQVHDVQKIREEITPEGVAELVNKNIPFLLRKADDPDLETPSAPGPARLIYYTTNPSLRAAQYSVTRDRQSRLTSLLDEIKLNSQRLTGTPVEWLRLNLTFLDEPCFTEPLLITPRQLCEAIEDGVDLQIIDLRPVKPVASEVSPFPQAFRWMSHEVLENEAKLSKEKWTVLIGDSNKDVHPIAWEFFQKGHLLTTILDGGYPAWVNATDR